MRTYGYSKFSKWTGIGLGTAHIIIGLVMIGLQVAGIFFDNLSTYIGATGIWGGVFIVVTGFMGIVAGSQRTEGAISAFMAIAVFATLVAAAVVVSSTWSAITLAEACNNDDRICNPDTQKDIQTALDVGLIVAGVIEYCVAFSSTVVCCWSLCCGPTVHRGTMNEGYAHRNQSHGDVDNDRLSSLYEEEEFEPR